MTAIRKARWFLVSVGVAGVLLFVSRNAIAHCDTMDGPVITEAKQALEEGDNTPILKWVSKDAEPEIKEAFQKALEIGSVDGLVKETTDIVDRGIRERFTQAVEAKKHKDESVEAGREFVEAYVTFMHFVERLYQDVATTPSHHGGEAEAGHAEAGQHDEHAQVNAEHK